MKILSFRIGCWLSLAIFADPGMLLADDTMLPAAITLPRLADVAGKEHVFAPGDAAAPVVLAWMALDCPMSKVYAPRLRELAAEMTGRGARFFLIDSSPDATPEKRIGLMNTDAKTVIPVICDPQGKLAKLAGARSTTEVIVLDRKGNVAYRGAVDDQYGYRRSGGRGAGTWRKNAPSIHYLRDAVDAVLAGKTPAVASTDPLGCLLEWTPDDTAGKTVAEGTPVFHGEVEKLIRNNCQDCHRRGGSAPFSLETWGGFRKRGRMIREVVSERRMPPWSASPDHGVWANDSSLKPEEITLLTRWIDAGMPAGDSARALPPLPPRPEWEMGTPDAIFQTEPFEVAATGQMPYRYVRIPTNLTEDRWVEATQILSSAPGVVHHVLVFVEKPARPAPGVTRPWTPRFDEFSLLEGAPKEDYLKWIIRMKPFIKKDMRTGEGGGGGLNGSFATSLSAGKGMIYPPGRAKLLPAGATLVLQIHYTPDGTKHESVTRFGVRYAKAPPKEPVDSRSLATVVFEIPPGVPNYEVTATRVMPRDALLLSLRPHMHLRGKSFRYVAEFPDGKEETLLAVPKWDFEWQVEYLLAQPMLLPKGTLLRARATYDNSTENPANPDPAKTVYFGLQSGDEMMIGYYEVVWGADPDAVKSPVPGAP